MIRSALIVGAGLIGGSCGLALRAAGTEVWVRDSLPGIEQLACELGVGAPWTGQQPDIVVIAAPPDVVPSLVVEHLVLCPSATVVDVASVKGALLPHIERCAQERDIDLDRYVGCHPMAGREYSGVVASQGDLFRGRPFVVSATRSSSAQAVAAARDLCSALGASLFEVDPYEHDDAVAMVSHVPQLVSSMLASQLRSASDTALQLAGQGVRDTTRIAGSDPRLWVEILAANAGAIAPVLREFLNEVQDTLGALEVLDAGTGKGVPRADIARAIQRGRDGVAGLPGKHGRGVDRFAVATVLVPDEPGQLVRLLADVSEAGINLEDLRLEHSLGQSVGLAHLSVALKDNDALSEVLAARGWARAGEQ